MNEKELISRGFIIEERKVYDYYDHSWMAKVTTYKICHRPDGKFGKIQCSEIEHVISLIEDGLDVRPA